MLIPRPLSASRPPASPPAAVPPGNSVEWLGRRFRSGHVPQFGSFCFSWLLFSSASMFTRFFLLASFLPFFPSSFLLPLFLSLPLLALFHFLILTTDQGKGVLPHDAFLFFNDQSASATSQENHLPRKL